MDRTSHPDDVTDDTFCKFDGRFMFVKSVQETVTGYQQARSRVPGLYFCTSCHGNLMASSHCVYVAQKLGYFAFCEV